MTATPDPTDPLHNEALEDLKKQDVEDLITPDEIVFQRLTEPEPTDAVGDLDEDVDAD